MSGDREKSSDDLPAQLEVDTAANHATIIFTFNEDLAADLAQAREPVKPRRHNAVRAEVVELDAEGRVIATHAHDSLAWEVDPISLEGDAGELATRPKHEPN